MSLLDTIALPSLPNPVKNIVVCTHAKFSTLELCRVLQNLGVTVTFHPVDYSREQSRIDELLAMGIRVIESPEELLPFITTADCAIEDGARVSKIIDACGLQVKKRFFVVEQTSGGVRYFKEHAPAYPVIDVAMSPLKLDIENQRATPEGVIQYFSATTGKLLSGKRVLVLGFGSIGEGLARLARTLGAHVMVYDTLATKRMFAKHRGYETIEKSAFDHTLFKQDVIFMATNTYQGCALSIEQLLLMKDGAIICNAGSGRGELGLELQKAGSSSHHGAQVDIIEKGDHLEVTLTKGALAKTITVLGKAFPINLHLGNGTSHDAIEVVMSMLLLGALQGPQSREPGLQTLAPSIQEHIAQTILDQEARVQFKPRYVQTKGLARSDRPYGGVFPFHNELSRDANVSVVRAWFKAGSKTRGHYHRTSQEAYYVEKGTANIILWVLGSKEKEIYAMAAGDYLLVPEYYFHDVQVTSPEDFECLVIATPPFQLWDQFFHKEVGAKPVVTAVRKKQRSM